MSVPTKQLGIWCGHLKANGSLCVDNGSGCGCCWYNLCRCLAQPPGKRYLFLSIRDKNSEFCFCIFFIASVWYRFRTAKLVQHAQTSARRPFILPGSSCLASTELVRCGKAWLANQNHNCILYIWWDWCLAVVWTAVDEVLRSRN